MQVVERDFPLLSAKEVNTVIKQRLRRKLSVVGACIGTDAHTVGIDAILNVKGIAGEKGLEYYRELTVTNMGAQVGVPELVETARAEKADAVLVSQVVTQRDAHLHNTREMSAAFREAMPAGRRPLLIVGGPRFDETDDRRAGRRPDLRPGHHARRGRQLPRARPDHATEGAGMTDARLGLTVTHRRYVPYSHAHYAGNLVDGAYALGLFGDVATEVCIRTDGDEGLFAGYADVRFHAPDARRGRAGGDRDGVAVGTRSRTLELSCAVVCRGRPDRSASAAEVLDPPIVAVTATGTVVVPADQRESRGVSRAAVNREPATLAVCADVGSTYTKAAVVDLAAGVLVGASSAPTTVGTDVLHGLDAAVAAATAGLPVGDVPWYVCSSAGGGLRLAVIGYEPLVTAQAGRRVGLSAGAHVVHVAAGRLGAADLAALRAARPDVVLLVGGTDGGDADTLTHNATRLARARWRRPVVYAGNADVRDGADRVAARRRGAGHRRGERPAAHRGARPGVGAGGDPRGVPASRHRWQTAVAGRPVRAAGAGGHPRRGAHRCGGARRHPRR